MHCSSVPRMAKSTPARLSSFAMAMVTFWFLSSKLPAQPTQYRNSWSKASEPSTIGTSSTLLVHAARSDWLMPHGLPEFSMPR